MYRQKFLFEIPDNEFMVVYAGNTITIDGKSVIEVRRDSKCFSETMNEWGKDYCTRHWFNPVFFYSVGNFPMLIGFVHDDEILGLSDKSPSSSSLQCKTFDLIEI